MKLYNASESRAQKINELAPCNFMIQPSVKNSQKLNSPPLMIIKLYV